MKFKLDENLPVEVAELMRTADHDVKTVPEEKLQGAGDRLVLDMCIGEDRVLVSLDTEFADIRAYPPEELPGVVVLRLKSQAKRHILEVFRRLLPLIVTEPLRHHLWIAEENRIRIHGREA